MTTDFILFYYNNHQAKKDIGEIGKKIENYSQKNVRIAQNSLCLCVCVCVDYIYVLLSLVV